MAYPGSNLQLTPCAPLAESYELNFRNLYLHHTFHGPNPIQPIVFNPNTATGLGTTTVNNWAIYDGLGPYANVVARARGLRIHAGDWHNSFTVVFEVERFRGSTLQVMGLSVEEGEWAIVGGTGQFAMAQGVIYKRLHERRNDGSIIELTIHGFCPVLKRSQTMGPYQGPPVGPYQGQQPMGPYQGPQPLGPYQGSQPMGPYQSPMYNSHPTKVGPWGGTGGTSCDVTETPQRLESVTIRSGWVIDSLAFSYIDRAGQRRTAGPWGGGGGGQDTIQLAPSEFVKEVSGTTGFHENHQVITSLKLVTNFRTYGPFGRATGDPFSAPVPSNSRVVGFFGRSGESLDSIGVYTA